jgi:hypothetical protein
MRLLLIGALLLGPAAASAQYSQPYVSLGGAQFNNMFSSTFDTMITLGIQNMAFKHAWKKGAKGAPQAPAHRSLALSDFKPVRPGHPTIDAFVAGLGPEHRKELKAGVEGVLAYMDKKRKNNLATAIATNTTLANLILKNEDPSDEAFEETRLSINDALAASSALSKMEPVTKQAMHEGLAITATLLTLVHEAAKKDPSLMPTATTLATKVLEHFYGPGAAN